MSQPTAVVDGDTQDPFQARARAQTCVDTSQGVIGQIDVCASNLEGMGVGPAAVGEIRGIADDIAAYIGAGEQAVVVFDRHATSATEIAGNEDVAGTTAGTYLDGANA